MNDNWIIHDNPPRLHPLDMALIRWSLFPLWVRVLDMGITILLAAALGWAAGMIIFP